MKRGFTLVEIIICVVLIGILGVSGIIINSNNSDFKEAEKLVMDAAETYLSVEVDEQGNSYQSGILMGGTGVAIPLKKLNESGYISNEILETLQKDSEITDSSYVLAAVFPDDSDVCKGEEKVIGINGSWNIEDTTYICNYSGKSDGGGNPILHDPKEDCTDGNDSLACKILNSSDLSSELKDIEDDYGKGYYYKSTTDKNFVVFGGMCWQILRIQGDGSVKMILAGADTESDLPCQESLHYSGAMGNAIINYSGKKYFGRNTFKFASSWINGGGGNHTFDYSDYFGVNYSDKITSPTPLKIALENWFYYYFGYFTYYGGLNYEDVMSKIKMNEFCTTNALSYNRVEAYKDSPAARHNYDTYSKLKDLTVWDGSAVESLKCGDDSKKFKSHVATITADEAYLAGLSFRLYSESFLSFNANMGETAVSYYNCYPTLTLADDSPMSQGNLIVVCSNDVSYCGGGTLIGDTPSNKKEHRMCANPTSLSGYEIDYMRPVIALNVGVESLSGNGTQSNPYIIN